MMEDELEDNAAMMVEDGAEAATRFSKMEIDCRFEENHVIERLTNDSCYVSRKLATNRNVPGNRDLNDFPFSPELSQVDTKLEVVTDALSRGMFSFQLSDKYEVLLRSTIKFNSEGTSGTEEHLHSCCC